MCNFHKFCYHNIFCSLRFVVVDGIVLSLEVVDVVITYMLDVEADKLFNGLMACKVVHLFVCCACPNVETVCATCLRFFCIGSKLFSLQGVDDIIDRIYDATYFLRAPSLQHLILVIS